MEQTKNIQQTQQKKVKMTLTPPLPLRSGLSYFSTSEKSATSLGNGKNPSFASETLSHNGTESKKLDVVIYEGSCANELSVSCVVLLEKDMSDTIINTYGLSLDLEGSCDQLGSRLDSLLSDIDEGDQTGRVYLVNDR